MHARTSVPPAVFSCRILTYAAGLLVAVAELPIGMQFRMDLRSAAVACLGFRR